MGMLDMAMWRGSRVIRMVKLALKAGSSKQGKANRAKVASNCVEAMTLVVKIDGCKMACCTHINKIIKDSIFSIFQTNISLPNFISFFGKTTIHNGHHYNY